LIETGDIVYTFDDKPMNSLKSVILASQLNGISAEILSQIHPSNQRPTMNETQVKYLTQFILLIVSRLIWVMPLVMGIIFLKPKFVINYKDSLKKLRTHHSALSKGPVKRYIESLFKTRLNQSNQITGTCTQCGNCCLNQQCFFLEPIEDGKFQCGVYNSLFRKFSNCGAFPISNEDIQRYECPGYVLQAYPMVKIKSLKQREIS
jgi:hypothetical protein